MIDLDRIEYQYDQAGLAAITQGMFAEGTFPVMSVTSSVGITVPAGAAYLLIPPYLLSSHPLAVNVFTVILHTIAAGLLWWIGQRWFSSIAGFIAGLSFAFNPWLIHYGRFLWQPNLEIPFIVVMLALILLGTLDKRRWAQVVVFPVLAFTLLIHYHVWAFIPALILWIAVNFQIWKRALLPGIILFSVIMLPFAVTMSQRIAASQNIPSEAPTPSTRQLNPTLLPLKHTVEIATGIGIEEIYLVSVKPDTPTPSTEWQPFPPALQLLWLINGAAALLGFAILWRKQRMLSIFFAVAIFTPTIALTSGITGSHPHYYVASLPMLPLLTGIGAAAVLQSQRTIRMIAITAWVVIWGTQVIWWRGILNLFDLHQDAIFGTPLHYLLDIREALIDQQDVLIVGGQTGLSGYDIWKTLLYPNSYGDTCVREVVIADGGILVFPAYPFAVLNSPIASDPLLLAAYADENSQSFPVREENYLLTTFDTAPALPPSFSITPIDDAQFSNHAALTGYELSETRIALQWRLSQIQANDYQYYVHLLDEEGNRIAQYDASFYTGVYWCVGDQITIWKDMPLPAEARTLRVGMYPTRNDTSEVVQVINEEDVVAPWVDIQLDQR